MPTVGAIDIKVVVPDLMGNMVAPELGTSENSTFVVLIASVFTLVCATRVDNVIVDEVVIKFCLVSNLVYVLRLCVIASYQVCFIYLIS